MMGGRQRRRAHACCCVSCTLQVCAGARSAAAGQTGGRSLHRPLRRCGSPWRHAFMSVVCGRPVFRRAVEEYCVGQSSALD